jgi:hypothetical protein
MTADMKETISAKTGTISWDVPSDVASIIQTAYGGQLKIGFWYIASTSFTIENITVYTDKNPKSATATTTTASTTTTTKTTTTTSATTKTTTSTTKTTTTTKPSTSTTTTTTTAADTGLTYTGTASKYGDVNVDGAVDVADVVLLNKALVQAATLSNVQKANADCHYNSVINAVDATTILKYLVMEYSTLPIIEIKDRACALSFFVACRNQKCKGSLSEGAVSKARLILSLDSARRISCATVGFERC